MTGPLTCRKCGYIFEDGDVAVAMGTRRLIRNPHYPITTYEDGRTHKSTYPIIINVSNVSSFYYCKKCYNKGIPIPILYESEKYR